MTKQEAIQVLNLVEAHGLADEAKKIAISALEAETVPVEIYRALQSDYLQISRELNEALQENKRLKEAASNEGFNSV